MGECRNHPGREALQQCQKHGHYLCSECLVCPDPELYCKFRSACTIWYAYKEQLRENRRENREG